MHNLTTHQTYMNLKSIIRTVAMFVIFMFTTNMYAQEQNEAEEITVEKLISTGLPLVSVTTLMRRNPPATIYCRPKAVWERV